MKRLKKSDIEKIEKIRDKKERTLDKVKTILKDICKDNQDIFKKDPQARPKPLESIIGKLNASGCKDINKLEKYVEDIAGARVTCCTIDEIDMVRNLIESHPDIKESKIIRDWKEGPDEEGYIGLHLLVTVEISYKNRPIKDTCEIQIRTLAMDLWATLSHRDFYKASSPPPPLVKSDMTSLSKLLQVADNLAVSLKQRRREALDKEIEQKAKGKVQRDMLTPINVQNLVFKIHDSQISLEQAYNIIQFAFDYEIYSLRTYKNLVAPNSKYCKNMRRFFSKYQVEPELIDYLHAPIFFKTLGNRKAEKALMYRIKELKKEKKIKVGEKGAEISKSKLDEQKKVNPKVKKK